MKKKIASTKTMALTPDSRISVSRACSARREPIGRRNAARPAPADAAAPAPTPAPPPISLAMRKRHVPVLLDDLLARRRQHPVDVLLHLALRLAERVHLQRPRQRIRLVERGGRGRRHRGRP